MSYRETKSGWNWWEIGIRYWVANAQCPLEQSGM